MPAERLSLPVSGGYCEGETPLPIPNRAVKPHSADGTWPARAWESRSPPVLPSLREPTPEAALCRSLPAGGSSTPGESFPGRRRAVLPFRERGIDDVAVVGVGLRAGPVTERGLVAVIR